jgi:hypothetical protein
MNEPYTEEQLDKALLSILNIDYIKVTGRPRACIGFAERVFIDQTPENENTELVRRALKDLYKGHFNFA